MCCNSITLSCQVCCLFLLQPTAEVDFSALKNSLLTSHPAKQHVFDFLCRLVTDHLKSAQISKGFPILDAILDVQNVVNGL
jgi:hypothetical protein